MKTARRCRSCKDVIEEDWWTKPAYCFSEQQRALAAQYCEECGREKILGILEAPDSPWDRLGQRGEGWADASDPGSMDSQED
ncbi:MAG: hypothetical protein H5U08_04290 [Thermogutta sp.]|uniref:hypothetical protein n=1 Tax=Thermogutta sp. TaxID=1962930 RepID=UPI0019BA87EF|nr:hypothetical protein [Thermogutta sp.]MBC7351558.1 hypothetical protein [Thermogutta sp.]